MDRGWFWGISEVIGIFSFCCVMGKKSSLVKERKAMQVVFHLLKEVWSIAVCNSNHCCSRHRTSMFKMKCVIILLSDYSGCLCGLMGSLNNNMIT